MEKDLVHYTSITDKNHRITESVSSHRMHNNQNTDRPCDLFRRPTRQIYSKTTIPSLVMLLIISILALIILYIGSVCFSGYGTTQIPTSVARRAELESNMGLGSIIKQDIIINIPKGDAFSQNIGAQK